MTDFEDDPGEGAFAPSAAGRWDGNRRMSEAEAEWEELQELFDRATAMPDAERAHFLDQSCLGRPELRRELEELLSATAPDRALKLEAKLLDRSGEHPAEVLPLPGYRVVRMIGRGGMGEVYLATREGDDFNQRVAVKLMRSGLPGPDLESRFRAERRILARLTHPLVVPLLDGGVTEDGRPYLVMPYVDGLPITDHCDRRGLSVRRRIEGLASVCRAVQHAHANLVVHRDLKPSNILVSAEGEPRLLDFGIAKLLGSELDEPRELTRARDSWVTPERAAPEQLRGETVSTATDVYALGVLLFELVTGQLPPAAQRDEDTHPVRPSAVVTGPKLPVGGDGAEASARAAARRTTPRGLRRSLRGDLDRIVMRALEHEPTRRYASAGQMGDDLERYLAGLPIAAQPDRWRYRTSKFVQRHRVAVAASALALGLLVAFAVSTSVTARRLAEERDRATAQESRAKETLALLIGLFDTTNPHFGASGDRLDIDEFLAAAQARVSELEDQPDLQARMKHVVGRVFLARSRYREAKELLLEALELYRAQPVIDPVFEIELEVDFARALVRTSDGQGAEEMLRSVLPRQRALLGDDHPAITKTLVRLGRLVGGKEGRTLAEEALAIERRRSPVNPTELARAFAGVAEHDLRAGNRRAAEAGYREAAELFRATHGEEHLYTLTTLTNVASAMSDTREKIALYRRVLETGRRVLGPESELVAKCSGLFAVALMESGELGEAESLLEESLRIGRRIGGDDHWRTENRLQWLGAVLELQGRPDEALTRTNEAVAIGRISSSTDPQLLGASLAQRSLLLSRAGRAAEAIEAAAEAIQVLSVAAGQPPERDRARFALGYGSLAAGRAAEAEPQLRAVVAYREKALESEDPRLGEARCALGRALAALDRASEAAPLARAGLAAISSSPEILPEDITACRAGTDASGALDPR